MANARIRLRCKCGDTSPCLFKRMGEGWYAGHTARAVWPWLEAHRECHRGDWDDFALVGDPDNCGEWPDT